MTAQPKALLRSYFNTGDIPTEAQFANLIDTIGAVTLTVAAYNASTGSKGRADYVCDGADDQVQIQAAIDALPAVGGRVLLTEGTFNIDTAGTFIGDGLTTDYGIIILTTHPPLSLMGIPGATIISGGVSLGHMVLIRGSLASRRTNPTHISGIEFDCNSDAADGLGAMFSYNVSVDHCRFYGALYYQIHFLAITQGSIFTHNRFIGQRGLKIENDHYLVANNIFDTNGEAALGDQASLSLAPDWDQVYAPGVKYTHFSSTVIGNIFIGGSMQLTASAVHNCSIVGNTFSDQTAGAIGGLYISSTTDDGGHDADGNVVIGNTFSNGLWAIQIAGGGATGVTNTIIAHNTISNGLDRNFVWGIVEGGGTCADNQILDNNIPNLGGGTLVATGLRAIVRGNAPGYISETKGAAAAVVDGGTIAHGLVATPTWVSLVASVAGEMVTATLLDAANITVAIKKHDGTPGTAQTIYWEAKV